MWYAVSGLIGLGGEVLGMSDADIEAMGCFDLRVEDMVVKV